jgi:hypothetical protein
LSSVIVHEKEWRDIDSEISSMKAEYGIPVIHARDLYRGEKEFAYLLNYPTRRLNILGAIFEMISRSVY